MARFAEGAGVGAGPPGRPPVHHGAADTRHGRAGLPRRLSPHRALGQHARDAPQVLAEAERALWHCPDGATFAHAYKADALYRLGFPVAAAEAAHKVPEKLPID